MNNPIDDGYPESDARRRWLRGLSLGSAAGAAGIALPTSALFARSRLAFPPAVFDAAQSKALIGLWGTRAERVHVRWASGDRANLPTLTERSAAVVLAERTDFAAAVALEGLPAGRVIHYAVYGDNEALSDVQSFQMPPDVKVARDFSIAFSGDIEERYRPFHVFDEIAKLKPDAFLMLGDSVYADIPRREFSATVPHYRRKHAAIRADRSLQNFLSRHAVMATWDDHEIENGSNASHPAIAEAEQVFREYWPCRSAANLGLYRALKLGRDIELFMLDTRRFRSPQSDADDAQKTMLGAQQKAQFTRDYNASTARYRLIASSVPLHGSSQDAWGNYANERDEMLAMFRAAHANHDAKTVILSADYHFAREWSRNEKRGVFEFMAGPLAAFLTFAKDNAARARNSRGEHFVFGDRANFGLLHYDTSMRTLRLFYYDDQGKQLFSRDV